MKKLPILTAILALTALASCRHKEFGELPGNLRVKVEYDWSLAPDASPEGMCVYFYHEETGQTYRFDLPGTEGGYVTLPQGSWHVMTYNNDLEGTSIGNQDAFHSHMAYTRPGNMLEGALGNTAPLPPRAPEKDAERVVITPDMMWGHALESYPVFAPADGSDPTVTLRPHEMVCTYDYEIRNVTNLNHVTMMCAAISSMSGGLTLHNEELHAEPVTHPLEARKGDATTITGAFYTFGHHPANENRHRMTLYLWMDDGRKLAFGTTDTPKWDVTDQVDQAPDPRHVHIVIDGLDIPVEFNSDYRPSTDDWHSEEKNILI